MIEAKDLSYALNGHVILKKINITLNEGEIIGIIGRSGSGKTALLKILAGLVRESGGDLLLDRRPLSSWRGRELHRLISSHFNRIPRDMEERVGDFLLLSRSPFKKFLGPYTDYDIQVVDEYIGLLNLSSFREAELRTLADGLLKRVMIAFSLIRSAGVLILDNPTSDLDLPSVHMLQKALSRYVIDGSKTAIIASNDLNFVLQAADRIILLEEGAVAMEGDSGMMDEEMIKKYFQTDVLISKNIYNGRPEIHFFPEN